MTQESISSSNANTNFLLGGGEMGARMREKDWSKTSLGVPQHWSQSLKTAVRIMLTCRQPMFVWWGEELINLYNDAYKSIVGGKHPEALGQPAAVVWREIWDRVAPRAESVLLKNEGTYDESLLLIMERNGYPEETYYTFSYSPIPDDDGGTGGIICANTDDTQRVIGERQLALLQELAAKTADARTFDAACTLSASCLQTNLYDLPFAAIYLVDPEQQCLSLAGTSGIERGHAVAPETVALDENSVLPFARVLKTQQAMLVSDLESHFSNLPMGAWQRSPHQAVAVPIAPSGQTGKAGILVAGLNPFRLFDDNYKGFIDLVAAQIAASIANAQAYEEERKRAEALAEIDRAKTVFFSNVSHEFRTPLTLMLGPIEETLLRCSSLLPLEDRKQLEMVQRNGLRLLKLVNTLLDFSRIEAGRVQASYEPTDLASFTAELASVFRAALERAGMRLSVNCPPIPAPVYVDREMWEKIVLNLISNAFKFTLAGEITVSLQWLGDCVQLSIQDTGIGIPAAEIPHLFERFHRVKGAQGRTFEGSGIGLSLVRELVQMHGGTVQVTSVLGSGSCFTVSIPTGKAHLPPERISSPRILASTALGTAPYVEEALRWLPEAGSREQGVESSEELHPTPDSPVRGHSSAPLPTPDSPTYILLADDNADMRDYVKRLLGREYEVEAVSDGLAALAAVRDHRLPDLVLTDVMMPGLDGFGLLQALRADPQTREVPIILLSARAGEEARVEGLEAGADDYLIKPFSARELLARVEATLKLSQMRQEAARREQIILERVTDAFIAFDREFRYTYVNPAAAKLTQKTPEELLGKTLWEVFPDTIGSRFESEYRRALFEQVKVEFEEYYQPYDMWVEVHAYPSSSGLSLYYRDISDRKQAEEALRKSEELKGRILESSQDCIKVLSLDGRLLYVNTGGLALLEIDNPTAFLDTNWLDYWQGEDRQSAEAAIAVAKAGNVGQFQGFCPTAKGKPKWWDVIITPIRDASGIVAQLLSISRDITKQKQDAAEREQLLEQERLAREEAQAANRIKDEFLAVLSHELRSPLNPILGWTKLLRSRKFDAQATDRALETIERNAKLQTQLIEDLLDVSRILQGKMALNITSVNLTTTIEAAIETVRLAARAKNIQIQTQFAPNVGLVCGDANRLQQVVWNLLSNAVKFTPSGGRIEVSLMGVASGVESRESGTRETRETRETRKQFQPPATSHSVTTNYQLPITNYQLPITNYAKIQVSDTGKGINSDFLPYVFDYFRQEDGTTTRKFGGLGLGLAIVRHITELHGGTVKAESLGEAKGATFTVSLPLLQDESSEMSDRSATSSFLAYPLQGIRVLVVDDEADMLNLAQFVLEQYGAEVQVAASAAEAMLIFDRFVPNVLISDIGMPDLDGYMLMQQVRQRSPQAGGQVSAIALTAYAGECDRQLARQAGFQLHLPKPVEPEQLVQAIAVLCDR
ncbi:ATP-binding protein [Chroococcidiopsis thermalis]|uniref:histidine kinase n=1 Tax=Chroococcidiopsis thermalis (strain PCC 7203) TaxID=251229 RepID=K9TYP1_CHRTP|nr:ATP-binding protein [Chroococcidiopsis thermalis]AFY87700.1 PAS/PAC sensor hybrid histidine kinase [Chroococcidiopsis thermalis PCC 7203]